MQIEKFDLNIRQQYVVPVLYSNTQVASIISSNKTFLLSSFMISLIFLLMMQLSAIRR